jgi:hypothetical protein
MNKNRKQVIESLNIREIYKPFYFKLKHQFLAVKVEDHSGNSGCGICDRQIVTESEFSPV